MTMNNNENLPIMTQVRFLMAGDVLIGSGFTVTYRAVKGLRTPKGKHEVVGNYPGSPVKCHIFGSYTNVRIIRP